MAREFADAGWVQPLSPVWPDRVHALTTTRRGPVGAGGLHGWNLAGHVGDREDVVAENRRLLGALTGIEHVQWLNQVHGTRCVQACRETVSAIPDADAAWTREPRLGLAVLTADCVPVVVSHRDATVMGVAHGGWRGLVSGVLERLVTAMPAAPADLVAWLGPAIGPGAYEVGEEVMAAVAALADGDRLTAECCRLGPAGRPCLDLFTLSRRLLERAGVKEVVTERLCTYSDERFFSYRRDGRTGRMVTLAWMGE